MSKLPRFQILDGESDDEWLVIQDMGPWHLFPTVTNGAEAVVDRLQSSGELFPGRRLAYYDSDGQRDEIVWDQHDGFKGFRFLSPQDKDGP